MEKANIIPDVIDVAPSLTVDVKYGNQEVSLGNILTPTDVKEPPTYVHWNADVNKLYLLCMIDPDAPTRRMPIFGEVNHWLIANISGNQYSEGQVLFDYLPSGPPYGTGLHRYIFLIYEQPNRLEINSTQLSRRKFSIRKFSKTHNLGNPIAGNFFEAKWDSSVPNPIRQLFGSR